MVHPRLALRGAPFFMPRRTLTLRHRLEYGLFRAVEAVLRPMPWRTVQAFGRALGRVAHLVDARHRRVVRENLRRSDLGLSEREVRALARECFAHFGGMLLATVPMLHLEADELRRRVRLEGLEHWDAVAAEGKGFIVLTGHYGNWEATALGLSLSGRPFAVVGRELDNPLLEPHLRALRSRFGNRVIPKAGAMRETLKAFKKGEGVGFLIDQDALSSGIFVKFLGRWASTHAAAATLAVRYGVPVLPLFSTPQPDGTVTVRIHPPFHAETTGDTERDVWIATQRMSDWIDATIRQDPRWWFWMHRRFKTQPNEAKPSLSPLPPPEWPAAVPPLPAGAVPRYR